MTSRSANGRMTPARLADGAIHMFESAVCVASLAAIVVLVLVQVFYRYVLSSGILWLNEVVINLMILLVLVGAALATRHAVHTDLRMLLDNTPPPVAAILRIIGVIATIGFLVAMIWSSTTYAWESRRLTATMTGMPLWLVYGIMPFGGVLILYEFLTRLFGGLSGRSVEPS